MCAECDTSSLQLRDCLFDLSYRWVARRRGENGPFTALPLVREVVDRPLRRPIAQALRIGVTRMERMELDVDGS